MMNFVGMVGLILEWEAAVKFYADLHYLPVIIYGVLFVLSLTVRPPSSSKKGRGGKSMPEKHEWYIFLKNQVVNDQAVSSRLIIWNTFSIRSANYFLEIRLSPFSSISSRISSTYSRVGLSTPISFAIWTRTCSNSPLSRNPEPSMSTLRKASYISFFIFLASFIMASNFFSLGIRSNNI